MDNLNTDQMFAGKHTYNVLSTDPAAIMPLLFEDFDPSFSKNVKKDDIMIAGDNFGCGSSREHPVCRTGICRNKGNYCKIGKQDLLPFLY